MDALDARQNEIYSAAFDRARERTSATNGQNLASDIAAPLRNAEDESNARGGSESQATQYRCADAPAGLNEAGTSENLRSNDTGMSPSTSINSAIEEPPRLFGTHDDGGIKAAGDDARSAPTATIPPELASQISALEQDFASAAEHLDPEARAELASIAEADSRAQSVLGAISQAAACMLGGLA